MHTYILYSMYPFLLTRELLYNKITLMIEVHICDLGMNVRESLDQLDAVLDLKIKFSSEIFETSW